MLSLRQTPLLPGMAEVTDSANTLAYYYTELFTEVKSFKVQPHGVFFCMTRA